MEQVRHLLLVSNELVNDGQPPEVEPQNNDYNHEYDIITYPEGTEMMKVTINKKRQIIVAAIAIDFDPNYRDQAECKGRDRNLFFPVETQPDLAGKMICGGCGVRWHCLEESLTFNGKDTWGGSNEGTWGGTDRKERRKIEIERKKLANGNGQTLEKNLSQQKSRPKLSEAKKSGRQPRYDQSIDKVRRAIIDCVLGESQAQASRNQGFDVRWLNTWKRKNRQEFDILYSEVTAGLDRMVANGEISPLPSRLASEATHQELAGKLANHLLVFSESPPQSDPKD